MKLKEFHHLRSHFQTPQSLSLITNKHTPNTNQNTNQWGNFPERKPVEFTSILISYVDLLLYLLNNTMVVISPTKTPQPPFPRGYNSNMTCVYHGEALGISSSTVWPWNIRCKVWLMQVGWNFRKTIPMCKLTHSQTMGVLL